jgi:hypothetical protein
MILGLFFRVEGEGQRGRKYLSAIWICVFELWRVNLTRSIFGVLGRKATSTPDFD